MQYKEEGKDTSKGNEGMQYKEEGEDTSKGIETELRCSVTPLLNPMEEKKPCLCAFGGCPAHGSRGFLCSSVGDTRKQQRAHTHIHTQG
eukprot:507802-Pelagomonas_calceolata.AAC.8